MNQIQIWDRSMYPDYGRYGMWLNL